ncbi:MAG: hypothetical protein WBB45_18595, partial [Cyclobacteriaceae bacterium]
KGVAAIFRTNAEGRTYGITFVDNVTRAAFKGSDLGKGYGVNALLNRMDGKPLIQAKEVAINNKIGQQNFVPQKWQAPNLRRIHSLVETLTTGYTEENVAYDFRKKRRRI